MLSEGDVVSCSNPASSINNLAMLENMQVSANASLWAGLENNRYINMTIGQNSRRGADVIASRSKFSNQVKLSEFPVLALAMPVVSQPW